MTKLLIFDYDNTLAQPVSIPSDDILSQIGRLLETNYIAVISGGRTLEELERLFVRNIPVGNKELLKNLFICPSYGNMIFHWSAEGPNLIYEAEEMVQEDKKKVYEALRGVQGLDEKKIKEKGKYMVIDCFGKKGSKEERKAWDPRGIKRLEIQRELNDILKERFNIFVAGRTSVDIVPKDKNKADNTERLARMLNIPLKNVIYTGDEFEVYGNDYPLLSLKDIHINMVKNPEETLEIMKEM